jgi:catechol 2,3-dioxygenase-like lactoylglutathione lyase family enzyme
MFSLHHVHLMASDVDATVAFWRDHFGAVVMLDAEFAGARNVFMRVGEGRLHLYAQPPKHAGAGTVHHLGVETDELDALVARLKSAGVSVTDVRRHPEACYAMAKGPDGLLLELFQPEAAQVDRRLADAGYFASVRRAGGEGMG